MISRSLWHENSDQSSIREEKLPVTGDILITSHFSFISQGTESLVSSGNVPNESFDAMKVPYMRGSFDLPCTYGYSLAGTVSEDNPTYAGKNVQLMHPHQDHVAVNPSSIRLLPNSLSLKRSLLVPNMETAINAVWNSGIQKSDSVRIIGLGSVGFLLAMTIESMTGARVMISDHNNYRKDKALNMGFSEWDGSPVDCCFNTSGSGDALQEAIECIKPYSNVVELSWYGNKTVNLKLGASFHYGNKRIISSQVSSIPPHMKGWDFDKRLQLVWQLLEDHRYDELLNYEVPFEETPALFELLRKGEIDEPGIVIRYV